MCIKQNNIEENESVDNGDKKYEIKLFVLKYRDYSFQIIKEFKKIDWEEDLYLTYTNNDQLLLFGKSI